MKIFLVRHGEATHNVDKIFARKLPELTNKGIKQANQILERFVNIRYQLTR